MIKIKISIDESLLSELDRYIQEEYGGDPRGMRSRVIRAALTEYLRTESHTHTHKGPSGPPVYTPPAPVEKTPPPVNTSRTDRRARALYATLKDKGMMEDPVRNAPAIIRQIALSRGAHPDTIRKYYGLLLYHRSQDKDLPEFYPPPPGEALKLINQAMKGLLL